LGPKDLGGKKSRIFKKAQKVKQAYEEQEKERR